MADPTLTQPLARMVDPGMTRGMTEWVAGHVLRRHLGIDRYVVNPGHEWRPVTPPLAPDRRVGVLGLGHAGAACARTLAALGFDVAGWSRTPKAIPGVACHHGADGLGAVLRRSEILVLLMPLTQATENLLDATRWRCCPPAPRS